jgi:hypothetical protein
MALTSSEYIMMITRSLTSSSGQLRSKSRWSFVIHGKPGTRPDMELVQ